MALLKKKTRKRLTKQMRKLIKKHGEDVVTGLVTTAAAAVAAKTAGDATNQPKKQKAVSAKTTSGDATQPRKQKKEKHPKSAMSSHAAT